MKRSQSYIWMAAGLTSLALIAGFTAKPLLAQIKAALVENIDEAGRSPYQSTLVFSRNTGGCATSTCTLIFKGVPLGKRLVATNITGAIFVDTPGIVLPPQLTAVTRVPATLQAGVFPGPIGNENMFAVNAPIHTFYDGGPVAPQMTIVATTPISFDTTGNTSGVLTLSGYVIDCTASCAPIMQ